MRKEIKQIKRNSPIAIKYEESGNIYQTIGHFMEIRDNKIDLRNFSADVWDLSKLPTGYTCIRIPLKDVRDYVLLKQR